MKNHPRITILHNIISPYRLPLFEALSKIYDVKVYFCEAITKNRLWGTSLKNYTFIYTILPHIRVGFFAINYSLLKELITDKTDCFIIAESPENALSILFIFLFARVYKKKIILWSERIDNELFTLIHFNESENYLKKSFYGIIKMFYLWYRKILYLQTNSIIALSNAATKYLIDEGVPPSKIIQSFQIMPESILAKPTIDSKKLHKKYRNKKIIFTLSYFNKRKGIDSVINAFNKLNRKDAVLLIAGAGDEEYELKKLASSNKDIHFLGYVDEVQKANYYASADFFVFMTHYDVWGFVVNEALYYGSPVISTDKACASELITDGKTGFVVKDTDDRALTTKMEYLLDNPKILSSMKNQVKKIPRDRLVDTKEVIKSFESAIKKNM